MGKSRIYSPCTNVDLIWKFMHSSLFRRQLDPLFRSFNAIKWTSEFRYSNKTQQQHWKYARTQVHWIFQISKYAYRHAVPNDYTRIYSYTYIIYGIQKTADYALVFCACGDFLADRYWQHFFANCMRCESAALQFTLVDAFNANSVLDHVFIQLFCLFSFQ